jgi:hypothetical protein
MQNLPSHLIEAIKKNLFPASHAAISDWNKFRWDRDDHGNIRTHRPNSSQALAIDVFGTIKVNDVRHRILGALARKCGLPDHGKWELELEWTDPKALLNERKQKPTQVDAIAFGQDAHAVLVIECKFTEGGGECIQPNPRRGGAHKGLRECNGDYAIQINPVNGIEQRCALTAKKIRYWETIPTIFGLDAEKDHRPCPFKGDAYQWMRNVVLADRLASDRAAVIAAYADADGFPTAKEVRRSGRLGQAAASGKTLVTPMSYQSIVT